MSLDSLPHADVGEQGIEWGKRKKRQRKGASARSINMITI
jgi:hypothetical protein